MSKVCAECGVVFVGVGSVCSVACANAEPALEVCVHCGCDAIGGACSQSGRGCPGDVEEWGVCAYCGGVTYLGDCVAECPGAATSAVGGWGEPLVLPVDPAMQPSKVCSNCGAWHAWVGDQCARCVDEESRLYYARMGDDVEEEEDEC